MNFDAFALGGEPLSLAGVEDGGQGDDPGGQLRRQRPGWHGWPPEDGGRRGNRHRPRRAGIRLPAVRQTTFM